MKRHNETLRALSEITDTGLFESLATAVLRRAKPELYGNMTQPGVNAEGKTVKSPLDGVSFVPGADPPHMVAVHHTICLQKQLREKWLHDPSTVAPRKGSKPAAPAGDTVKTAAIAIEERSKSPALNVTLALTTNKEPLQEVTRDSERLARIQGVVLDIWAGSRIADYLDRTPDGQGIRKQYLGIEQERLSPDLLRELSRASLEAHQPRAQVSDQVTRDDVLSAIEGLAKPVGFLIGESGFGKSVASHQYLGRHIERGGCGIFLTHDVLASSQTLDQALDSALRQLHPVLSHGSGAEARSLCSPDSPFYIVVEDVSRSGHSAHLIERLAGWAANQRKSASSADWRLICPVWPELLSALGDETRKQVEPLVARIGPFAPEDARRAILTRAALEGAQVSAMDADILAERLGYDPLLIALSGLGSNTPPERVVAIFVDGSTGRLAASAGTRAACDYVLTLRSLAGEMLARSRIDPAWSDVRAWFIGSQDEINALRELARHGEIVRLEGFAEDARLRFRHDRVRKWLLVDAATNALREQSLDEAILAEPFFADVLGTALADPSTPPSASERARVLNPLALFHALHSFREPSAPVHHETLAAIERWLADEVSHSRARRSLRYAALHTLSTTQSSRVVPLLRHFRDRPWTAWVAGLRNGDLRSGVNLCCSLEPGTGAGWRDRAIEHAKTHFGLALVTELSAFLKRLYLTRAESIGALRLAGHLGVVSLAEAIAARWDSDAERAEHLDDYLWAVAQCGGDRTEQLLSAVCDAWSRLPAESQQDGLLSSRDGLAAHHVAWAFWKSLPERALGYFIDRATRDDLRGPIAEMLHGVDHPDAVAFIATELAAYTRGLEGTDSFVPFISTVCDHWRRRQQERSRPMSQRSRAHLRDLWADEANDRHLRRQSFGIWAATSHPDDLSILRTEGAMDSLQDEILRARVERGDQTAIPQLIDRIRTDEKGYWWHIAREIWSEELTATLDAQLTLRGGRASPDWGDRGDCDWIMSELLTRLEPPVAEHLLCKHWGHLRFSRRYVQAALFTATPRLLALVAETVRECPSPSSLFEHIDWLFGIRSVGHPGVTRIEQLEGLTPYLEEIDGRAIHAFWEACNERGWLKLRLEHLDSRLSGKWRAVSGLDDGDLFAELDRQLTHDRRQWLDFWVERHIGNGRSIDSILDIVRRWLASHKNPKALEVAASIVIHVSGRDNVDLLNEGSDQSRLAVEIIEDTRFAVFRRTLS